jgi:hypothetical protein
VSVAFSAEAVKIDPSGELVRLEGPNLRCSLDSRVLFDAIECIPSKKGGPTEAERWPWYFKCFSYDPGERPSAKHCHDPATVLRSIQGIEQELVRRAKRLPARWYFTWTEADGKETRAEAFSAAYRGRHCAIFSDDEWAAPGAGPPDSNPGVWAKELDAGPRQGVHHDIKAERTIIVRFADALADTVVTLHRIGKADDFQREITELKKTCIAAMQQKALLFTAAG